MPGQEILKILKIIERVLISDRLMVQLSIRLPVDILQH